MILCLKKAIRETRENSIAKKTGPLTAKCAGPGELNREVLRLGDVRISKDPHQLRADGELIHVTAMRKKH